MPVQEICLIASDAFQVLELGDQQLLNLIPASRSVTTESVGKLRRVCMEFLAACISWDQFRCCPVLPLTAPPCLALLCLGASKAWPACLACRFQPSVM